MLYELEGKQSPKIGRGVAEVQDSLGLEDSVSRISEPQATKIHRDCVQAGLSQGLQMASVHAWRAVALQVQVLTQF